MTLWEGKSKRSEHASRAQRHSDAATSPKSNSMSTSHMRITHNCEERVKQSIAQREQTPLSELEPRLSQNGYVLRRRGPGHAGAIDVEWTGSKGEKAVSR